MADEYIERGALLAAYDKEHEGEPGRARKLIEDAPAADVAPVRHGRWVKRHGEVSYWHECSECGEKPPKDQWKNQWLSSYCPNCGAKMDGEA